MTLLPSLSLFGHRLSRLRSPAWSLFCPRPSPPRPSAFSPLTGFMNNEEYEHVVANMRLQVTGCGVLWGLACLMAYVVTCVVEHVAACLMTCVVTCVVACLMTCVVTCVYGDLW